MRLGILCTMINGFGRKGFYNSQELGLARALARQGHMVCIYKGVSRRETEETILTEEGITLKYMPMKSIGANGIFVCSRLELPLEGLFCFADQQLFLPHVYRFCARHHICFVPYVGTAHSLYGTLKGRITNFLFSRGTLQIYRNIPVVAKTDAAAKELQTLGVMQTVVANVGLDATPLHKSFEKKDKVALKKQFGFQEEDVLICNVSRLVPEKRPLDMIALFLKIRGKKPFKLVMVGKGPLQAELKALISLHDLDREVLLLEEVPYEDMWKIYGMSAYYVNLNKGEIFGMSIMEAVYYQVSVAAIEAPGPTTTLLGLPGHILCKSDEEIAEWLIGPYPPMSALEESAGKILGRFTWKNCADAFLEIVKKEKGKLRV